MIVAFEGMDGCGKSTIASMFANKNNFIHETQRIMSILNISRETFDKLVTVIRKSSNEKLALIFYTFRCMLDNETKKNVVIERTMVSTYYFEKNKIQKEYWDFAMQLGVIPDITFVLYASAEERYKRIYKRDCFDKDLNSIEALIDGYGYMLDFIKMYSIPYVGINTENFNEMEIVDICTKITNEFLSIKTNSDRISFLKNMNIIYGFENCENKKVRTKI